MYQFIKLALGTTLSTLILVGCAGSNTISPSDSQSGGYEMPLQHRSSMSQVQHVILQSGEELGLKMTEFKYNALLAEKISDEESASATITFTNTKITIKEDSGDIDAEALLDTIQEHLNETQKD